MASNPSQVITFFIGNQEFCVDARIVRSIVRMDPVTKVPGVSNFVTGAMYCKGNIVPVIDLVPLGVGKEDFKSYTRLITAEYNGETIGLAVSSVGEAAKIPEDTLPTLVSLQSFMLDSRTVVFLDLEQILQKQAPESLQKETE